MYKLNAVRSSSMEEMILRNNNSSVPNITNKHFKTGVTFVEEKVDETPREFNENKDFVNNNT